MSYRVLRLALIAMCVLAAQAAVAGAPLDTFVSVSAGYS